MYTPSHTPALLLALHTPAPTTITVVTVEVASLWGTLHTYTRFHTYVGADREGLALRDPAHMQQCSHLCEACPWGMRYTASSYCSPVHEGAVHRLLVLRVLGHVPLKNFVGGGLEVVLIRGGGVLVMGWRTRGCPDR